MKELKTALKKVSGELIEHYDADHSGAVEHLELRHYLDDMFGVDYHVDDDEIDEVMQAIDGNHDGALSKAEIQKYLKEQHRKHHANIEQDQEANADHHDAASSSHAHGNGEGVNEEGSRLETQIEGAVQRGLSELLFDDGDDDDDDGQEEEEGLMN